MPPRISVIIPCHNQGRFLPESVGSLGAQTLGDWECIIVDDGSTDESAEVARIVAITEPRVRVVRQENRGVCAARNRGVAEAAGPFIQFLDADDLLEPDKLAWQRHFLEEHPDVGIVYGDARYFRDGRPEERRFGMTDPDVPWVAPGWEAPGTIVEKLLDGNLLTVHAALTRRSVLARVGGFDPGFRAVEDWELWLRCAMAGTQFQFAPAPNTLALVRIHPASLSQGRDLMRESTVQLAERAGRHLRDGRLRALAFGLAMRELGLNASVARLIQLAWGARSRETLRALLRHIAERAPLTAALLARTRQMRGLPTSRS